jgi:hypothetical protein
LNNIAVEFSIQINTGKTKITVFKGKKTARSSTCICSRIPDVTYMMKEKKI